MSDDLDNKRNEIAGLQDDLKTKGLSRRTFLDRLKAIGLGFGAAGAIGAGASAREAVDANVSLKSTNPALDGIITEGREDARIATPEDGERTQVAQMFYRRFYRRGYRRFYRRYGRVFYRRRRIYRRFFYSRFF